MDTYAKRKVMLCLSCNGEASRNRCHGGQEGKLQAEADRILREKDIFVLPDILTNAGGVIVPILNGSKASRIFSGKRRKLLNTRGTYWYVLFTGSLT
jgi:hypothetical protein